MCFWNFEKKREALSGITEGKASKLKKGDLDES